MLTLDAILHPTDFSASARHAFAYAVQVARHHGADLHMLNVAPNKGEDPVRFAYQVEAGDESAFKEMHDRADAKMVEIIEQIDTEDITIKRVHTRGIAPGPEILTYADDQEIDLVVMGTHGRRGIKRLVLGSVTEEVVRQARCSVLTVRGDEEPALTPPQVRRILVPVDLSKFTRPLLEAATDVAMAYSAEIDLLHVVEPLPFPTSLVGGVGVQDLTPNPVDEAQEQLRHLIEESDVPIAPHVEEGHAAKSIIASAETWDSDLIMIASHGLSGLQGMLLGSVTARVVRRAHCPVWTARIRPEDIGGEEKGA